MDEPGRADREPLSLKEWVAGLRASVSLLYANGHPEARHYPVPTLWMETKIVRKRLNNDFATSATLLQMAVAGVLSTDANTAFEKKIKELTGN